MDIKSALKILTSEAGVSGEEFPASEAAASLLGKFARDVNVDAFGNVTGYIYSGNTTAKTIMLDAHIDRVGLVVTFIDEQGFVHVGKCGAPDVRTLLAQSVTIHGKKDISGVVSALPPHVSKEKTVPEIGDICVDVGMTKEKVEEMVSLGDKITINSRFRELMNNRVSAPAIDDRSGICAVLAALDMLKDRKLAYNIAVSFSSGEEVGGRGARMTAFSVQPDEAIAVDVSFGKTPDSSPKDTAELGSGVMIGFSAALDKEMSNRLCEIARRAGIPFTREIMPESTGTNADTIGISGKGVKCCTLSFPIRFMHTSVETVEIDDIEATARLICEYIGGCDE